MAAGGRSAAAVGGGGRARPCCILTDWRAAAVIYKYRSKCDSSMSAVHVLPLTLCPHRKNRPFLPKRVPFRPRESQSYRTAMRVQFRIARNLPICARLVGTQRAAFGIACGQGDTPYQRAGADTACPWFSRADPRGSQGRGASPSPCAASVPRPAVPPFRASPSPPPRWRASRPRTRTRCRPAS